MMKHESLPQFLLRQNGPSLRLSFEELEEILGFTLPENAYANAAWWSNDAGHSHAGSWLLAGWLTSDVDLDARKVAFRRDPSATSKPVGDPFGCMAGTVTIMPGVDLTAPSGEIWNADAGILYIE